MFIKECNEKIETGNANERTFYHAIENLIDECGDKITANVELSGEQKGIPDIHIFRSKNKIGIIEVKDLNLSLSSIENSYTQKKEDALFGEEILAKKKTKDHNEKQFAQYLTEYPNLIYTNIIEWRRYRNHNPKPVQIAKIANLGNDGKLHLNKESVEDFEKLIELFLAADPIPQTTAKGLAVEMARLTKVLRDATIKLLENKNEFLKGLYDAFKQELIQYLSTSEFADMYAQTIAYGLFTARMMNPDDTEFNRHTASLKLPKTNPFLRKVFKSLADEDNMPYEIIWIVEDIAALIKASEMGEIRKSLQDFRRKRFKGDAEAQEKDPTIYFYENFLAEYDPKKRESRGVYYTPLPVVSYIVRSIDEILKDKFGKPDGLADNDVIILDPACGTGTFLYEVIRVIYEKVGKRSSAYWKNEYVPKLLGRIFGFELLMAPYTIAHLKLAQFLRDETGYEFDGEQRLGIFLTNTLQKPEKLDYPLLQSLEYFIVDEQNRASDVKEEKKVMVVLGNPPYSGHSMNKGKWATNLVKEEYQLPDGKTRKGYYKCDGKPLGERNPKWLQDDYVKFLRWGQWRIDRTGYGILGMITNHGYLDNPTFRGMRQGLMQTFDEIYIYDLHGNAKKKETAPDGGKDENVFDIMQGVAIGLFVKNEKKKKIKQKDLYGLRSLKYATLYEESAKTTKLKEISPKQPYYLFIPRDDEMEEEYERGWKITEIMPTNGVGMTTAHDDFVIDFERNVIVDRFIKFKNSKGSAEDLHRNFNVRKKKGWDILRGWKALQGFTKEDFEKTTVSVLYRPFDKRWIFWQNNLVWRTVKQTMRHMLQGENLGMIAKRQNKRTPFSYIFVSDIITESCVFESAYANISLFPLYLYLKKMELETERKPNISPKFVKEFLGAIGAKEMVNSPEVGMRGKEVAVSEQAGKSVLPEQGELNKKVGRTFLSVPAQNEQARMPVLPGVPERKQAEMPVLPGEQSVPITPEDIFYYIYAVLHSPTYRKRYAEFLKIDFPRIPLPKNYEYFDKLADFGKELVEYHLLKKKSWGDITQHGKAEDTTVGKVEYDEQKQEIILDAKKKPDEQVRLGIVPKHIWEFHIGGYQVLSKWLKDRKGRKIDMGDYIPIINAIIETDRIMEKIDPIFREMIFGEGTIASEKK